MAGIWKLLICSLGLCVLFPLVENSKLNVPRVLLPIFKDFSTNFTLDVDTGCYKWTTSRIDLIRLSTVYEDDKHRYAETACSKKVIVSSISKETSRNTAIVFAEEVNSGRILRCDVIVDIIHHLNIVTTTRELYMEEAPEAFEVRAYDDQGNEFTTLEGVEFQWSIGNWNTQQDYTGSTTSNVLRFITFRDSPYETPQTVEAFDKIGKHGHIVLLEGIKTGSAKVSVRLPHPEYQDVPPIEVQLMVVANLIIDPSDIYLLEGDSVHYQILQVHDGHLEEIPLPSKQYFLEIQNKSIASLDEETSIVRAQQQGKTKVLLHDRNVDETENGIRAPSASLTVSNPCYLTLAILPHRNWIVLIGEPYEIIVEIYDCNDHKLHLGEGVQAQVKIPKEYFTVQRSTQNNTHHYGWPIKLGSAKVYASLESVRVGAEKIDLPQKIEAEAEMLIYECVTIQPSEVYLPWDSVLKPTYEVSLNASGGDGSFLWSSTNSTIAVVTQSGLVTTNYHGEVAISAAMTRNHFNYGVAQIYILPPDHLQIVEYVMEAELGVPIFIHLALYAEISIAEGDEPPKKERIPFMHCDDLPFLTKVWNENFLNSSLKTSPVGISCGTVAVIGTALGTSKVTVSYTYKSHELEDTAVLATYKPLKVVHPVTEDTVLAVGTSREIVFSGGPRPWVGRYSEHTHRIEISGQESSVTVEEMDEKASDLSDVYVYKVLCQEVGETEVKLFVSNLPSSESAIKAEATASVKVHCAKPRYISLHSELEVPDSESCPLNLNSERVVTQNYKDIEITVSIKDENGHVFDNISSLYFDWKLSHPYLGAILEKGGILAEDNYDGNILLPSKYYQILKPKGKTGVLDVSASVVAYQTHLLSSLNIVPESPPFGIINSDGHEYTPTIKASISLILVNDTIVVPNKTQVFNHPLNKVELQVNQGSGHYEFVLSTEGIADINYVESTRILEIIPKLDGLLKLALVDLCLVSKPAVAEIQVVGVGSIKVDVPERIEREQCVQASVRLYDTSDSPLAVPPQIFLELRAAPETGIIGVRQMTEKDKDWKKVSLRVEEVRFIVTGLQLGETNLVFITGKNSREVRSQPVPIQVFPPLRLYPRNITLVVGSHFQISSRGGPQPDANVEYVILNERIINITTTGVIRGLYHGCTTVIGKILGISKTTGSGIKYSEDKIEVHVIPLKGIKIHAPIIRLKTGNTMPIWAQGIPDQLNPLIIGALQPSLIFKWSLSTRNVGILHHAYEELGLKVPEEDMVSMRFTAVNPGRTTVKLSVVVPPFLTDSSDTVYKEAIEIEVFEELKLVSPPNIGSLLLPSIIMAPNTELHMKTNRDDMAKSVSYSVGGGSLFSDPQYTNVSKALAYPTEIVSVDQTGLVTTHNQLGKAAIIVVATEEFGVKQVTGTLIEVKQIQYLMLTINSGFKLTGDRDVDVLPQGTKISFTISYHDRSGSVFTTFKSELKVRTNRIDLANFRRGEENDTLTTKLMQSGDLMLKVWDDLTLHQAADYMKISIGELIYRNKEPLVVGDRVCFSVPLTTKDGKSGKWESDNEDVLPIDSKLGIGRVKKSGTVSIKYLLDDTYTYTELSVLPVSKIIFLELPNKTLTNTDVTSQFRVPIVLRNIENGNKLSNFITSNGSCHIQYKAETFPFMCELRFDNPAVNVDIADVFAAFQNYDSNTGTYGCEIISAGEPSLNKSMIETNFTLYVFSGTLLSNPLHIPFAPAVFVHEKEVNLSDVRSSTYITVSGTPDVLKQVEAEPANKMELEVVRSEEVEPTRKIFYLKLTPYFWNEGDLSIPLSVYINSPETQQRIKVPVKVKLASSEGWNTVPCIMGKWSNVPISDVVYYYRHTFTVIGSLFIILAVTVYVFFNYINPMFAQQNMRHLRQLTSPSEQPLKSLRLSEYEPLSPVHSSTFMHPRSSILTSSVMGQSIYGDPQMYYQPSDTRVSRTRRN